MSDPQPTQRQHKQIDSKVDPKTPGSSASNILEVKNLDFYYDRAHVLKSINANFKKHRTTAIIGPSGSGNQHCCVVSIAFLSSIRIREPAARLSLKATTY